MVKDITDSRPSGFCCALRDSYSMSSPVEYASHKQTEEALRESEARLKLALEAARLGTWEWKVLTGEVIWSPECEALFGLTPGSFEGTYEAFAQLVHSDDKESMTRSLQETMQQTGEWEMDYRAVHPDGSIRWVVSTGKFLYNESGQAVRMLGVLRDITERKQAEDALRRMNETLEIRVAERTAELARANTQLQQELLERQRTQQALQQQQSLLCGIIEGTTDLIAAMDMDFRYTAFNSAYKAEFLKIFGREIEIGTSMIEALAHLPEEQAKAVDIWGRALAGEEFTVIQEFGDTARERNYYEITYSSIRDENGQRIGASHIVKDVSDRIRVEEELRQSNHFLQQIADATPLILYLFDIHQGTTLYLNHKSTEMLGYSPQEICGAESQWLIDRFHPDDRYLCYDLPNRFINLADKEVLSTEYRFLHKNGEWRWLNTREVVFARDSNGVPTQILGSVQDINDRIRAEKALKTSEKRLQLALEGSGDGLWDWNIVTGEVYYSPRYLEMLGYQMDELPGDLSTWERLVHPDDISWVMEIMNAHLKDSSVPYAFDYRVLTKSGEWKWIADYGKVVERDKNGLPVRMSGTHRDISDRKQSELDITQSRDLKEAIFNESADAIFLVDPETLLTLDCNRRAVELFEAKSKDELLNIGNHTLQRQPFTPEELAAIAQEINTGEVWSREVEYLTKKGNLFWGNLATKQINVVGKAMNLVRITDITERKQAEERIKASLKEKEVLLKEIHHRVKNNLQIVDSLLQMQSRRTQDRQAIEILRDSRNRIASIALVHEKLYRSEDLGNINFAQYIPDLIVHLFDSYNIGFKNINLHINIDDISLDIGTAMPCGLIVNELVSNALKYAFTHNRQGEIYVQFLAKSDRTMMVIVRDNGIGIPDDFDIETSSSLGLTLVQGLVEQLEGTLECERAGGTEFRITFPGGRT